MLNKQKTLQTLGLAQRAGKISSGDTFEDALLKNRVSLVFLASDASDRTRKQVLDKSAYRNIQVISAFTKQELSLAIGKEQRVALGVLDHGFSKKLITYMTKEEEVTQ